MVKNGSRSEVSPRTSRGSLRLREHVRRTHVNRRPERRASTSRSKTRDRPRCMLRNASTKHFCGTRLARMGRQSSLARPLANARHARVRSPQALDPTQRSVGKPQALAPLPSYPAGHNSSAPGLIASHARVNVRRARLQRSSILRRAATSSYSARNNSNITHTSSAKIRSATPS